MSLAEVPGGSCSADQAVEGLQTPCAVRTGSPWVTLRCPVTRWLHRRAHGSRCPGSTTSVAELTACTASVHAVPAVSLEENRLLESRGQPSPCSVEPARLQYATKTLCGYLKLFVEITDKGDLNQREHETLQGSSSAVLGKSRRGRIRDCNLPSQKAFISILMSEFLAVSALLPHLRPHRTQLLAHRLPLAKPLRSVPVTPRCRFPCSQAPGMRVGPSPVPARPQVLPVPRRAPTARAPQAVPQTERFPLPAAL